MGSRRDRILEVAREIHPNITLSQEVIELLDGVVNNFLSRTLMVGEEKAQDREASEIRICDVKEFVEDVLELDVLGFTLDDLLDEAAVGSTLVLATLSKKEVNPKHNKRLMEKQQALDADAAASSLALATLQKKKKKRISKEE